MIKIMGVSKRYGAIFFLIVYAFLNYSSLSNVSNAEDISS